MSGADPSPPRSGAPPAAAPWPNQRWRWQDAGPADGAFGPSRGQERRYARQLRSVAGRVRQIVQGGGDPDTKIARLRAYARAIGPWAERAAAAMIAGVDRRNAQQWERRAAAIGAGLKARLDTAVNGATLRQAIAENAAQIASLPSTAASKVAERTAAALTAGTRAETLARQIQEVGDQADSRAQLIARTEIGKAQTELTRQRAQAVGSPGYIWRTARDGTVRDSHAAMEGQFVPWESPPTLDGITGHAGAVPNCRCRPEPVIPTPRGDTDYPSPLPVAEEVAEDPQRGLVSRWERDTLQIVAHEPDQPLPGAAGASVSTTKLAGYVLDPAHPQGKGRVFQAALGMDARHAEGLREQILAALPTAPAQRAGGGAGGSGTDGYGERFRATVPVTGPNGRTMDVVTAWIYDRGPGQQAASPRLVSVFPADRRSRRE